jgi:hypothetical protein
LIAELEVGTLIRQEQALEDAKVRRLKHAARSG